MNIIDQINAAKEAYYNSGNPIMTDTEYDALLREAEQMGYTETVGFAPVESINTITHEHKMLSLDKRHTVEEVQDFIGDKSVVAMWKADGLTISCTYIDGILTRLETRGNGQVGNDIMFHANSFENLPKKINKAGKYVIDGECVILYSDFEKINAKLADEFKYKNPRNLASGSLNLLNPEKSAKRHLRFYAWDVIEADGISNSLTENLIEASHLGFDIVMALCVGFNIKEILDIMRKDAQTIGFPIDGIVFKYDNRSYGKSLGATDHHFRNAIAYKFEDDKYPTKLKDIVWQIGKTGQLTPVAIFDPPVDISGSIVEKASIHNVNIMKQLGLTKGCTVYIYKANDIIPQIYSAEPDGTEPFDIPVVCPECGAPTYIKKDNDTEVLMCSYENCPGVLLGKWEHYVSKKAMDIDGLSSATLETFLKRGYLDHVFVNLYSLGDYKKELYKLDGFGKKSIDNLLVAIEKSKDVTLQRFITAFSIPGIGEGQSKLICAIFKTFDEFYDAACNGYDFSNIPGIGKILNANIHKWIVNNGWQMIDVAQVVRFVEEQKSTPTGVSLSGKTFVVTGSVNHFKNRDELKKIIEDLGGKCAGSVSKSTSYLINNDTESTSSKNIKAKSLGVQIISEEDFLKLINKY